MLAIPGKAGRTATPQTSTWRRFERNIEQDFEQYSTSYSWLKTHGIRFRPGPDAYEYLNLDDIRLSNSMTVEHNTLGPGVIGHILRNRTINKSTYATTDRWFAYDQVGSVMATLDSNGSLVDRYWQDSFGNVQDAWGDGLWGAAPSGWHHNTKESDKTSRMVYMYQRWYDSQTGRFASTAPYPPWVEHPFSFANLNPIIGVDYDGRWPGWLCVNPYVALGCAVAIPGAYLGGRLYGWFESEKVEEIPQDERDWIRDVCANGLPTEGGRETVPQGLSPEECAAWGSDQAMLGFLNPEGTARIPASTFSRVCKQCNGHE